MSEQQQRQYEEAQARVVLLKESLHRREARFHELEQAAEQIVPVVVQVAGDEFKRGRPRARQLWAQLRDSIMHCSMTGLLAKVFNMQPSEQGVNREHQQRHLEELEQFKRKEQDNINNAACIITRYMPDLYANAHMYKCFSGLLKVYSLYCSPKRGKMQRPFFEKHLDGLQIDKCDFQESGEECSNRSTKVLGSRVF